MCKRPMIRIEDQWTWEESKVDGHKYHPAKIISNKWLEAYDKTEYEKAFPSGRYKATPIPCGKCIECRLEHSREWAARGFLEGTYTPNKNWFVTLTYDDEFLPKKDEVTTSKGITYTEIPGINEWKGTLNPKELQLFTKKLRKIMADKNIQSNGIRVISCGEYGEKNHRPHYHLILLNCNLPSDSFYHPRVDWEKYIHWQNKIIEEAWTTPGTKGHKGKQKGICEITEANWNTIAYVARYVTKKIYGDQSEDHYAVRGQEKEFFRVSNRPGIARQYYEDNKKEIYKNDRILIRNNNGNIWVTPPEYFDKLYEKEDPEHMKWIKERRREHMEDNLKIRGSTTSLSRWEQYQVELREIEAKSRQLIREM